jgi:Bacterial TniB protein
VFLQLLRFLSNELRLAFVGVGVPEARYALLSDGQLRSRFTDVELPPWALGEDMRDFVTRLTWSLPLREPSPVDSPKLRRLLVARTGGITLGMCKVFERAAIAAIRDGREKIDLEQLRGFRDLARRCYAQSGDTGSAGCGNRTIERMTSPPLPLAPRPHPGEAVSSWVRRVAARYDILGEDLVSHVLGWRCSTCGSCRGA